MTTATAKSLPDLYLDDETAWLDAMADLIRNRDLAAMDLDSLGEYLTDMATSDRRAVKNRLVALLAHLLKWEHQKTKRSRSWRTTILNQRRKLVDIAGRGVLRVHADAVLPEAYGDAIELAMSETNLPRSSFPETCPYTVEGLLTMDLSGFVVD